VLYHLKHDPTLLKLFLKKKKKRTNELIRVTGKILKLLLGQARWHKHLISALRSLRQEDQELEASLVYIADP
jgi:seryl-tRNA(Sec) selenium transferase